MPQSQVVMTTKRGSKCQTFNQSPLAPCPSALAGTFFVPTGKAWDNFFATVVQRQGNPQAPAMVARYGQVMLYHLAQNINVPIATPTPGANKFAFDTASTLQ